VVDQRPAKAVENGVSRYLQQPLRSLEQVQQDRERRTAAAATAGRTVTSYASSIRRRASFEFNNVAAAELPAKS
jgi:hypothetical protein